MGGERHVEDSCIEDGSIEDGCTRLLLSRAPVHAAVLSGDRLTLGYAVPPMLDPAIVGLGCSARDSLRERLGPEWVARIDRARETGEGARGRVTVDGASWELSIEPLDGQRVALYTRRLPVGPGARALVKDAQEMLHSLRNPIYGLSAATDVLLSRAPEGEMASVLQGMREAADQAELCLGALGDALAAMKARAEREEP